ncbi:MAG: MFS transporter [Gammaproteobacteria bacterium]|nr:MFS transporter [Gammaproteobacteria bacterium]
MIEKIQAPNQFSLLGQKRFRPFFLTQFLGAFNDNSFKNALIIVVAYQLYDATNGNSDTLVNLSFGLFILPFFLFSATAGQLADKYEKSGLIRRIKALEVFIMCVGAVGFYLNNVPLLLIVLFLMGSQSTFFGPIKYGILPQVLTRDELVGGNALVETGTFVAILLGMIVSGVIMGTGPFSRLGISVAIVFVAVAGWLTSRRIPKASAADPDLTVNLNFFSETIRLIKYAKQDRTIFLSILGVSWFWFYGTLFLAQLPSYAKQYLGGNEQVFVFLVAAFTVGIGAGSLLCERMSAKRLEIGLVPFGSIGMTLFAVDLAFAHPTLSNTDIELAGLTAFLDNSENWHVLVDLVLISLFAGFYIVPLYAFIQNRSDPAHRSRIIAANNVLNALFMVLAALIAIGLLRAGLTIPQLFLTVSLMNAAVALFIYKLVPEFLMRLIIWLLVHTIYRLEEQGIENIPDKGPAVLVCNHVSFVDALIIASACRRPVRFVMDHNIFKLPVLNFVFRTGGTIPIASAKKNPEVLDRAFDQIASALEQGEIVCIFPEGKITSDGKMNPFRSGIERIVERTPVPVIPLALRGLWGSLFSRHGGAAMRGLPRRLWARIVLAAAPGVPPQQVSAVMLENTVATLRGEWA